MSEAFVPGTKGKANIPPIEPMLLQMAEQTRVYIFNVGPDTHSIHQGTMGFFLIPACPEGADVSAPIRYQGRDGIPGLVFETIVKNVDGRNVDYEWKHENGAKVAQDIIGLGAFKDKSQDLTRYGVFIAAGPVPTEAEKDAARQKWYATCDARVQEADRAFEINGGMETNNGKSASNITATHVQAAKVLGISRPWARVNQRMESCSECGRAVFPGAARCSNDGCGAILDEAKARIKFPHLFAHEEKRGRPRNDAA